RRGTRRAGRRRPRAHRSRRAGDGRAILHAQAAGAARALPLGEALLALARLASAADGRRRRLMRVLVVGAVPLGLTIVERLHAAGAHVTVLADADEVARYGHELARTGAVAVTGSAVASGELLAAGLAEADVLVLAADSDSENVDAALTARRLHPAVRLVVR